MNEEKGSCGGRSPKRMPNSAASGRTSQTLGKPHPKMGHDFYRCASQAAQSFQNHLVQFAWPLPRCVNEHQPHGFGRITRPKPRFRSEKRFQEGAISTELTFLSLHANRTYRRHPGIDAIDHERSFSDCSIITKLAEFNQTRGEASRFRGLPTWRS